jgi:uncharacterized protein (TIRG00374 family)
VGSSRLASRANGPERASVPALDVARNRTWGRRLRAPSQAAVRRVALLLVGAAVSAACLWLAVRNVSLAEVWSSLETADWIWLVPTLAFTYATLFIRAVRWRFLFQDPHAVSTWEAAKALNIGLLFNAFLPSRAGEVPRIFALARSTGQSKLEVTGTIVVERLLDLFSVAVIGVVIWPWLPDEGWIDALCVICGLIVAGSVAGAVATWLLRRSAVSLANRVLRAVPFLSAERSAEFVASLVRGVRAVRQPRRLALALALSGLVWLATYLSIVALYPAFDLPVGSASAWLILVVTSLAMTIPSTAGGLGVYEAAVQSALVATGVASGLALSFALALHAVNLVPIAITGAIAAWGSAASAPARPEGSR